jgi:hypothetical protein
LILSSHNSRAKFILCILASLFLFTSASSFDEVSYQKFKKLKITSFKIISRETVRIRRTDTMPSEPPISGYRIVEYNFPIAFISSLLSYPVRLDTVRPGSPTRQGCVAGWAYCIINGKYKVQVPCGFDMFRKTLSLSFADSAYSIKAKYSLKNLGAFLKEVTVSDTGTELTYDSLIDINRGAR